MNSKISEILISIVVIIGCIILFIIYKPKEQFKEHFMSNYRESDMFIKNQIPPFISNLENKKDLIINDNNNFPIKPIEIKAPIIIPNIPKPNEAYKDVNFDKIRDNGVDIRMKQDEKKNNDEYNDVIDATLKFSYPKNSGDFLTEIDIKKISKDEYNNNTLADIFNKSTARVINHVSDNDIKNILGKPIEEKIMVNNMYKPELSLIDKNLDTSNITDNISYKYSAFNELPFGSLI